MIHKQHYNVYVAACAKDGGIYHYQLELSGELRIVEKIALEYPMYMAVHRQRLYVVVREPFWNSKQSGVVSYGIEKDGRLGNKSAIQSTGGEVGCHVFVDDDGVYCANYMSGSVVKLPDKIVTHKPLEVLLENMDPLRQNSPHTHQVIPSPDRKYLCVPDLGLDRIYVYDKQMNMHSVAVVPTGHGPRHMVFSSQGNFAYCVNELASTVTVFGYNHGKLKGYQTYNIIPGEYVGKSTAAAVRLSSDNKYLYLSNRGHDSISRFEVMGENLRFLDITHCGGIFPRDFDLTSQDEFLVCANEGSGVSVFKVSDRKPVMLYTIPCSENPLCVTILENMEV